MASRMSAPNAWVTNRLVSESSERSTSLIVTNRDRMRTVQIGLTMLGFAEEGEKGAQFAAAMIVTIPFLALLAAGRNMIMKALVDTKED